MSDAIQEDVSKVLGVNEAAEKILAMDAPELSEESPEEETVEEPVEDTEESTEEPEETDLPEEDEVASYLSNLTENLKEGQEYYDQLKIPTKINGIEGEATITDLIRDYQKNGNLDQKTDNLTKDRTLFDEEVSTKREEYGQMLNNAAGLVDQLEQQLITSTEKVDWNELRENDPAEFAAKKQEVLEKQQQYQSAKQGLAKEFQEKKAEHFNSVLARESKALIREFPAWKDESVAKAEKSAIRDYLLSEGFSQLEVDGQLDADGNIISAGMIDHKSIRMAHKAMQFDKGDKKVETAKKRLKTLPKVAKPGKPVTRKDKTSERSKALRGRLKKSGRVDDAAALIMDKLFGGS
jgi:hypothetical protein